MSVSDAITTNTSAHVQPARIKELIIENGTHRFYTAALQSQKTVYIYMYSKQILPFCPARPFTGLLKQMQIILANTKSNRHLLLLTTTD